MTETRPSRLLLLEDEKNLGSTLAERLKKEGFDVLWTTSARQAKDELVEKQFDLALLDVGLGDGSGFEVGRILKEKCPQTAIIFLTARGDAEDRVRGLELGAEDYIVKPFHLKELILRINNGLKRAYYLIQSTQEKDAVVVIGKAKLDFHKFEAEVDGARYTLTHKEAALMKFLVERRGTVVSRDEILNHAWSKEEYPTPRTVDNFIMRLRRLVEPQPENPQVIKSVRGVGYQLL